MKKKVAVIGAGFSGLSAAAYLGKAGHEVHVFEKNSIAGGRARQFKTDNGFVFDMGPSWYWMPDVIDQFFADFGFSAVDFYHLERLNPQFTMVFPDGQLEVPADYAALRALAENLEPGAGIKMDRFMEAAKHKYEVGMLDLVQKPCHSWSEFMTPKVARSALQLDLLNNFRSYVRKFFKHPWLISLMEFPVIFLGASPKNIPALYSLMNYGGYVLGTWYPQGGFFELVKAMQKVGENHGVRFHLNEAVSKINTEGGKVKSLETVHGELSFDAVLAAADYHHVESLLPPDLRNYKPGYWSKRVLAPSALIYYLGFKERIPGLNHHTLFFENDLDNHLHAIYNHKRWPEEPLFYACCPSKTDPSVAPPHQENIFLLMPLATGIEDHEPLREKYFQEMLNRLERHTGVAQLAEKIIYKKSYCVADFVEDYNALEGNAYGLANTLRQTAVLKPAIKNRKLSNLFYAGQLTVPGPGVPPAIISGKIAANELIISRIPAHESIL